MGLRKSNGTVVQYLTALAAGERVEVIAARHGVKSNAIYMALKRARLPTSKRGYENWVEAGGVMPEDKGIVQRPPHNAGKPKPNRIVLTLRMIYSRCEEYGQCLLWPEARPLAWHDGKVHNLRRLVWSFTHPTRELPADHYIYSTCNNPRCLAGACLVATSRKGMGRRMAELGTYRTPGVQAAKLAGIRANAPKLTMELARQIRAESGTNVEIGAKFGISRSMVSLIKLGTVWKETPTSIRGSSVFAWAATA